MRDGLEQREQGGPASSAKARESTNTPGGTFHGYYDGVRAFCDGDYDSALRRFSSILVADPSSALLHAACGHCCLHGGDRERALEHYDKAQQLNSSVPEIIYNRAVLFAKDNLWSQAIPLLEIVYKNPPEVQPGAFYLGLLFDSEEELCCDIALYLGNAHRNLGRHDKAREWYERALQKRPSNITARQRLAEIAILTKKYTEATGHLNRVLDLSPLEEDKVHAHNNLGIAAYENGAIEEGISHFTWVLRHAPGNPTAIHNLNFIYEREGVFEKEDSTSHSIRFMDVREGASPIFGLRSTTERGEGEQVTVIGRSAEMLRVMRHARVAATSDSPVLIQGENGTGKELIAQVIALNSSRRDGPFIVVNCASVPELLLESGIFGHEKGAFTGARARKLGDFEMGSKGTVFLDEITALTPMLQGRLLRTLRSRRFTPMGGTRSIGLDIRLIAATHRNLMDLVREGSFREDLYYELAVIPIEISPLRDRKDDIPLLVEYFLHRYSRHPQGQIPRMAEDDLGVLREYDWPGNVRELENLIARAVVMGTQSSLYLEELARLRRNKASARREQRSSNDEIRYPLNISLADLEKRHILRVLEVNSNNQRQAARVLGINPSTLWRKLKGYDEEGK